MKSEVYSNFITDSSITIKNVYGEDFLIADKAQPIVWKITGDTREIAGFHCKRANGLILDSVYVVAFYTEDIIPSGGPESFCGLPGMILGVSLPHENITWFATNVEINVSMGPIALPKRTKSITRNEFKTTLQTNMKNWMIDRQDALKALLL
jgi:GLPGLI family protein